MVCSNQFLNQEPGSSDEIKNFALGKGFKGLLMEKIDVNGPKTSPVYTFLKVGFVVANRLHATAQSLHKARMCISLMIYPYKLLSMYKSIGPCSQYT